VRAICVDDEELVLRLTVAMCKQVPQITEAEGFTRASDALEDLREHEADVALLDIDMPEMNGIELALKIREMRPNTSILFLTGYSHFAVDAFSIHAAGYLLKPVTVERLIEEISYTVVNRPYALRAHIFARTFGEFDLLVDGTPLVFPRAKSKEILAYLIDRRGGTVTRPAIFAALWEDEFYDRPRQKQLDVIIRDLRKTLDAAGVGEILEMRGGTLRVNPDKFECDMYRFFAGDVEAINSFHGEYMNAYSWAQMSEAYLARVRDEE